MRLVKGLSFKVNIFTNYYCRCYCTNPMKEEKVKKYVYISKSTDIFTNLALENWIYSKFDFTNQEILMLWQSGPCVVTGRHQNPWLEANVDKLKDITGDGVKLARRDSGGGTVYHDEGNLNMTFFTSKENYNRKHNLQIITKALFREYKLKIDITEKYDLALRGYKVSGTASKLARPNAYHHCTLLINVNKKHLHNALDVPDNKIETRATKSIKSPVLNLKDEIPSISIENVLKAVGFEFLHSPCSGLNKNKKIVVAENGFQLINPTETWFPGIDEICTRFKDWDWVFGMCPEFSELHSIEIPECNQIRIYNVNITVEKGRLKEIKLESLDENIEKLIYFEEHILAGYKNKQYSTETINNMLKLVRDLLSKNLKKEAFNS